MATATENITKTLGSSARKVRIGLRLTQQQLADMTGVSREDVDLFENNRPVYLDARRRILQRLWAIKVSRSSN